MQIDHIIPESIAENPDELRRVRELFALPDDFEVNVFENWAPTHSNCNRTKAEIIYVPSLVVQHVIEKARRLGPEAKKFAEKALSDREIERAKSVLKQAQEKGQISDEDFKSFSLELLGPKDGSDHQSLNIEFLKGIIANVALQRAAFHIEFIANDIGFNVNGEVKNEILEISLTVKQRRIMRVWNYFSADVEFELTASTERGTIVFVKLNSLYVNGPDMKFLGKIEQEINYSTPPEFENLDNTD